MGKIFTTNNVSGGDLSPINTGSGAQATDNAVIVGAGAAVGNTTLTAGTGGTVNINGGTREIADLSARFADDISQLSSGAIAGSVAQSRSLAESLKETFGTAFAGLKDLTAAKQSEGLTTAMKFMLALAAMALAYMFFRDRKKT